MAVVPFRQQANGILIQFYIIRVSASGYEGCGYTIITRKKERKELNETKENTKHT